jgi:hypothetical protein
VRQGQQNRRGRGRNRKGGHNPLSRSFESNGPDVKIRGTPAHIAEKYLSLARDAQSSGDPVLAENYLQHAEHYNRIIMAYREQLQQPGDFSNGNGQRRMGGPSDPGEGGEEFGEDDGEDAIEDAFGQPQPMHAHQGPRFHEGNRNDRQFRRDRDHGRFRDRDRFNDRGGERQERGDRQGAEFRPAAGERSEQSAEGGERRRDRFQHDQPEFLRRPVRRSRGDGEDVPPSSKDEG